MLAGPLQKGLKESKFAVVGPCLYMWYNGNRNTSFRKMSTLSITVCKVHAGNSSNNKHFEACVNWDQNKLGPLVNDN